MVGSNVLEISLGTFSAYLTLALTLITLLNPITAIYFVRSYRDGFLRLVGVRQSTAVLSPSTTGTLVSALFDPATRI
ncbi:hypothetical protein AAVH_09106 [Aphelenchoides avenae]|nr:hypothetical protein AAVH_09106 [Aphelenchus avenae]